MMNFCTLFDSSYLDKGIVLYKSIEKFTKEFCLFVFCFDDKTYDVLNDLSYSNMVVIKEKDIVTPVLLEKKKERSRAEYCWTCTPIIIEYVIKKFGVSSCTYLDSDLFFFNSPEILINEIEKQKADTCIVPHRFNNDRLGKELEKRSGKYCVQFNYFKNSNNGMEVLNWWKEKCLDWCYDISEEERMGDQKYLNYFEEKFSNVYVLENLGGGIAPWNLKQYRIDSIDKNSLYLCNEKREKFVLIFYHFQNIRYFNKRYVNIKSMTPNKKIKYCIYIPYLLEIEKVRLMLKEKYNIDFYRSRLGLSNKKILGYLQRNFAAFKIRYLSDIIDLRKLDKLKKKYIQ